MSSNLRQKINTISENSGLILLYHSVAGSVPDALQRTLHNVTPQVFESHLEQLSPIFNFVSLNEFAQASNKQGLATITFDDGYKNVFENALPILESFDYPFTLFLNTITFKRHLNWRDKVRYIIHHDLVDEFKNSYKFCFKQGRFYRYSKNVKNNSAQLDRVLDEFLIDREIEIYSDYPYLMSQDLVLDHKLISYGNHSHNHYVLASLDDDEQIFEIGEANRLLKAKLDDNVSRSFSAPFGGSNDVNLFTKTLLKNTGYQDILMSRQRLQPNRSGFEKIQILERFMPRSDDIFGEIAII